MIIICEPQCIGFEHVEVNMALLNVISIAFPNDKILFFGESTHLGYISNDIHRLGLNLENIKFFPIKIPPRNFSNLRRLGMEISLVNKIGSIAKSNEPKMIIFLSVTSSGLTAIKLFLYGNKKLKFIVIPHNILETILNKPSVIPWEAPFWFRWVLMFGNKDNIRYLLLGPSIKDKLIVELPNLEKYVLSIDLPYPYNEQFDVIRRNKSKVVTFGVLGVGGRHKGTDLFFKLAAEVSKVVTTNNPKFILIGHIVHNDLKRKIPESVFVPSPDKPLTREDFDMYAKSIDYAVYPYNKDAYRLTASGAFFDAVYYAKPVIAIKNPFFEYYFKVMGNIGFLCDDYNQMKETIIGILNNDNTDEYDIQANNIMNSRKQFTQTNLAEKLKSEFHKLGII